MIFPRLTLTTDLYFLSNFKFRSRVTKKLCLNFPFDYGTCMHAGIFCWAATAHAIPELSYVANFI